MDIILLPNTSCPSTILNDEILLNERSTQFNSLVPYDSSCRLETTESIRIYRHTHFRYLFFNWRFHCFAFVKETISHTILVTHIILWHTNTQSNSQLVCVVVTGNLLSSQWYTTYLLVNWWADPNAIFFCTLAIPFASKVLERNGFHCNTSVLTRRQSHWDYRVLKISNVRIWSDTYQCATNFRSDLIIMK